MDAAVRYMRSEDFTEGRLRRATDAVVNEARFHKQSHDVDADLADLQTSRQQRRGHAPAAGGGGLAGSGSDPLECAEGVPSSQQWQSTTSRMQDRPSQPPPPSKAKRE